MRSLKFLLVWLITALASSVALAQPTTNDIRAATEKVSAIQKASHDEKVYSVDERVSFRQEERSLKQEGAFILSPCLHCACIPADQSNEADPYLISVERGEFYGTDPRQGKAAPQSKRRTENHRIRDSMPYI